MLYMEVLVMWNMDITVAKMARYISISFSLIVELLSFSSLTS